MSYIQGEKHKDKTFAMMKARGVSRREYHTDSSGEEGRFAFTVLSSAMAGASCCMKTKIDVIDQYSLQG